MCDNANQGPGAASAVGAKVGRTVNLEICDQLWILQGVASSEKINYV